MYSFMTLKPETADWSRASLLVSVYLAIAAISGGLLQRQDGTTATIYMTWLAEELDS